MYKAVDVYLFKCVYLCVNAALTQHVFPADKTHYAERIRYMCWASLPHLNMSHTTASCKK